MHVVEGRTKGYYKKHHGTLEFVNADGLGSNVGSDLASCSFAH